MNLLYNIIIDIGSDDIFKNGIIMMSIGLLKGIVSEINDSEVIPPIKECLADVYILALSNALLNETINLLKQSNLLGGVELLLDIYENCCHTAKKV